MADAKKGTLIVLEGLDGSGKATQAKLLATKHRERSRQKMSMEITFPDYASDSSALVKMYLGRTVWGRCPNDVNAYAASSFYAVDRYASYKTSFGAAFTTAGGVIDCGPLHHIECSAPVLQAPARSSGRAFCSGCLIMSSGCWDCLPG